MIGISHLKEAECMDSTEAYHSAYAEVRISGIGDHILQFLCGRQTKCVYAQNAYPNMLRGRGFVLCACIVHGWLYLKFARLTQTAAHVHAHR